MWGLCALVVGFRLAKTTDKMSVLGAGGAASKRDQDGSCPSDRTGGEECTGGRVSRDVAYQTRSDE